MSTSTTTTPSGPTPAGPAPRSRPWSTTLVASVLSTSVLLLPGCTAAPESAGPAPASSASPAPASSASATPSPASSASSPSDDTPNVTPLTVDITIADGDVTPNGQKLDVAVGQPVVLDVTSDETDSIHAHTGGDGFELEVEAGTPATGTFTLTSAGSFEVESHHLDKVIVILNAR